VTRDWQPACGMEALYARGALLRSIREFFHERGVLEVQTAVLAAATVTEPAVESLQIGQLGYLQTSPEYQMKRLLAAGAPSIYQIAPVFRAGEAGRRHNPEFIMLEWYRVGFNDCALMAEVAELLDRTLGPAVCTTITYDEVSRRVPALPSDSSLSLREAQDLRFARGLDTLGPGRFFITDYPADQAALARLRPERPDVAARFEVVVDGVELANGYWELGDAEELRARFQRDLSVRRGRGQHLPSVDERLLDAMAAGLPPCAGVALGFDRLLMAKLGAVSLQDVMPFPIDRA
jgi:elongation factor P--(R)-beta-lysine ligase